MMELEPLGDSGLMATKLGLGLAALGRPGYINLLHAGDLEKNYDVEAMRQNAHAVLDKAYDSGVRYFDVARSYGKAEEFLASWLKARDIKPNEVTVASKWGYTYTADWKVQANTHEVKEHTLAILKKQWKESKSILGDYITIYQIHSATLDTGVLQNKDILLELARMKKEEGIKIGVTVSGDNQAALIGKAINVRVDKVRLFDIIQATWNVLEQSASDALYAAHIAGLGVVIKEALANGRLTQKNTNPDFILKLASLNVEANRLETSVDALAMAAVLSLNWVDVVLSGATNLEQMESNLGATSVEWDYLAAAALSRMAEHPPKYWEMRSQLKWN
ncbi:MAG: aldo/keto reductase [Phototrophicaceae bacterium]